MEEYIFSFETQDGLTVTATQGKIYENPNAALGVDIDLLYLDCFKADDGKYIVKCGREAHSEKHASEATAAERLVQFAHIWHHRSYWQNPQLESGEPIHGIHYNKVKA